MPGSRSLTRTRSACVSIGQFHLRAATHVIPPRTGHLTARFAGSDNFRELRGSSRAPGPTKLGRRRGVDGDRLWKAASGDRSREMDRTLEVVALPVSDVARSVAIDRC